MPVPQGREHSLAKTSALLVAPPLVTLPHAPGLSHSHPLIKYLSVYGTIG
jgi:hypothetical protein